MENQHLSLSIAAREGYEGDYLYNQLGAGEERSYNREGEPNLFGPPGGESEIRISNKPEKVQEVRGGGSSKGENQF